MTKPQMWLRSIRDEFLELVQRGSPTAAMPIARVLVEELLVSEREQRAVAVRLDFDGHQRFPLWRRFPRPGEDEFVVGHEFAIDAADVVLLAVWTLHLPAIAPADTRVALDLEHFDFAGTHPAFYFFRIGPGREDFGRRGFEPALERETRFRGGLGCHDSSSKNAARLESRSDQNFSYRLSHSKASRIGSASSRQATVRPALLRLTRPASDRTSRCFITPGKDIANGAASSETDSPGCCASRITSARRVASESAAKVRSSGAV